MNAPLLSIRGLTKSYPVNRGGLLARRAGSITAVDRVSFDLALGETLGLVGESGSGKTTVARCILRAVTPTAGAIVFSRPGVPPLDLARATERELKPVRTSLQMIFQDPYSSLNPRFTVGAIVREPLDIHRVGTPAERERRVADILERVGLKAEHRHRYPHAFSGGQRQRIGIARALVLRPSLVVADEAVSALDVSVQAQVLNLLKDLQHELQLTYLFVAHNLDVVRHFCDRVAVMHAGRLVELAPVRSLFSSARHPYTRMLLAAIPNLDPDRRSLAAETIQAHTSTPSGTAVWRECGPGHWVADGL